MKSKVLGMHVVALVLFLVALGCYFIGWNWTVAAGVLGLLFEVAAWVIWIGTGSQAPESGSSRGS